VTTEIGEDRLADLAAHLEAYKQAEERVTVPQLIRSIHSERVKAAFMARARTVVYLGGWRSSKTSTALVNVIVRMAGEHPLQKMGLVKKPPLRVRVMANDFDTCHRDVIIPRLKQYLPTDWNVKWGYKQQSVTIKPPDQPESWIQLCTYNQSFTSLGGVDLDIIICDEMPPDESIYNQAQGRLMDRDGQLIIAATADLGLDWSYYGLYLPWKGGDKDIEYHHLRTQDNVDENNNPRIKPEAVEARAKKMSDEERRARIEGEYVALSGLCWPNLTQKYIKKFPVPSGVWCHYFLMDYHSAQACACIWAAVNKEKRVWVYAEAEYQLTLRNMAKAILDREGNRYIVQRLIDVTAANPERGGDAIETAIDKLTRYGLKRLDTVPEKDTSLSITLVRDALEENRLIIHEDCRRLIVQAQHLQWEDQQRLRKLQEKRDRIRRYECHFADLLRYLFMYDPYWRSERCS
jgi:hypothetical protein